MQISHGKGEHRLCYMEIIEFLTRNGYLVVINDHRGHGAYNKNNGCFKEGSDYNNFLVMVKDLKSINLFIREEFPSHKVFLLGHSMGAYLSLKYSEVYGDSIDGLIISGIGKGSKLNLYGPYLISTLLCGMTKYVKKPSNFIKNTFNKTLNKTFSGDERFKNLLFTTGNEEVLNKYHNDEKRIKVYSLKFYHDLFDGIKNTLSSRSLDKIPKDLNILHLTGELDPVCSFVEGSRRLYHEILKRFINIKSIIYKDTRHEVFVEDKKLDAFYEVLNFIENLGGNYGDKVF